jgi:hypothetical protein
MAATVEKARGPRGRALTPQHKARIGKAVRAKAAARRAAGAGQMPAVRLRLELCAARRAGLSFEEAWPPAVDSAVAGAGRSRRDWIEVLGQTRGAWERAYLRDVGQPCWNLLERARI